MFRGDLELKHFVATGFVEKEAGPLEVEVSSGPFFRFAVLLFA